MKPLDARGLSLVAAVTLTAAAVGVGRLVLGPVPTGSGVPSRAPIALPVSHCELGVESTELASLAHASPLPVPNAFFPAPPAASHYEAPPGLRRTELDGADTGLAPYFSRLLEDGGTRRALAQAIARSGRYDFDVPRILRAWHVPEEVVAVAFVASALDDEDGGIWRLSDDVAKAYGLVVTPSYDERRSISLSTEVAAHYLSDLHERFGSWDLAVAAFGVGYGQVSQAVGDAPPPDPQSLRAPEGLSYLRAVAAVALVLANRESFGFADVRREEPAITSDLEVPAGTPFAIVARAGAVTVAELRALNPEYRSEVVPNAAPTMVVHVPAESLARTKELLVPLLYATDGRRAGSLPARASADAASTKRVLAGSHYYRAEQDEPLGDLAQRLSVDARSLASENALDPAGLVHAGQLLSLPRSSDASP